jgi:hypothetical protein
MAKKKAAKKKAKRKLGKKRTVPKKVAVKVKHAISAIRIAKGHMEKLAPKSRKAWAELHNCESRLTRLV